jgi:peptidoglycan/xylan/chitin deacetylase (PgdA/CDA1 family)
MAKYSNNTYKGGGHKNSRRKQKILIRRWTLIILLLLILIGIGVLVAKLVGTNKNEPSAITPTPELTALPAAETSSPEPTPTGSIGPDKASPAPSGDTTASPEVSGSPENTDNPEASPEGTQGAVTASAELASTNLLELVNNSDGVKTAYLTFDDGPTKSVTPRILDTLRKYNIKATFFEVGTGIEANADMARRVYEEGHLIANHSYSHNYKELYPSEETFITEVTKTEELIRSVTGEDEIFKLFRFPGGSFKSSNDSWSDNKQKYKETLKNNGYVYCDWNSLNGDAEGGTKTKEQLIEGVKSSITTKDGVKEDIVVLMHDAAAKSVTADALPEICEYLISQGYEFRRLDEFDK